MLRIVLIICACFIFVNYSVHAQQVATIHVKAPFDRKNGVSFSLICSEKNGHREIFVSKNGDAYLYWANNPSSDTIAVGRDSVSISSDTGIIADMNRIITYSYIESIQHDCPKCSDADAFCGYFLGIRENGLPKGFAAIDLDSLKKYKAVDNKLQPLIKMLNDEYLKYKE